MAHTLQKEKFQRCVLSLCQFDGISFPYPQWIVGAYSDRANQSTKLHHFKDHWSLTTFVTKNVTVKGKKKISSAHQNLQFKALSMLCNNLLTTGEQTQACTTNAARPCQQLMAEEAAKAPQ